MLETKNIVKRFNENNSSITAVNNVNIQIEKGKCCALVGESGSGKSTLSRLLIGITSADSGEILLDGVDIRYCLKKSPKSLYSKIQLVLQDSKSSLNPFFTVFQSIAEPLETMTNKSKSQISDRVYELMAQMHLSPDLLKRKSNELSGGQLQHICLARALASSPSYLILDEVISGLDVILKKDILELLKEIQEKTSVGYLFITHDMDAALYLADKVYIMKNGEIVCLLAESYTISEDGKTYTFKLKEDILFSDGEALNAEAVKKSFETSIKTLGQYGFSFDILVALFESITAIDEYTLELKLTQPFYATLNGLTKANIFGVANPAQINDDLTYKESFYTVSFGTGAYMYEGDFNDNAYTFVKNPNYWGEEPEVDSFAELS